MTLLDIIAGSALAPSGQSTVPLQQQVALSIQQHLSYLFNTRRGSLYYLPDYGLPDVQHIYRGLPSAVYQLIAAMTETITRYEPRLTACHITPLPRQCSSQVLQLHIAGSFQGAPLAFDAQFGPQGVARVLSRD